MAARKSTLGRNLDALLGPKATTAKSTSAHKEGQLLKLPVEYLQTGKYQPRNAIVEDEALQELAASIKAQGIIQPIVVRPAGERRYEILAGERRWRAAQLAGLSEVPVVVREVADKAAIAIALIENIQRENLNPIEEATALERLINEFSLTHQQAADAVGRSRAAVSNLLRLMNLNPEVKALLAAKKLEMGHARALLALTLDEQQQVANMIIARQLSVRETESSIRRIQQNASKRPSAPLSTAFLQLQDVLSVTLGSQVTLKPGRNGSGQVVIHYKDRDQLAAITTQLGITENA